VAGVRPDPDPRRQGEVVEAFLAAARGGDFAALLAVLDPDVELRADLGHGRQHLVRGARDAAGNAAAFARRAGLVRPVLVNGAAGLLAGPDGRPQALLACTVRGGRISRIEILADPPRLHTLSGWWTAPPAPGRR
jgi:RNA polymerase sigma-70 factor (ECF subfamily)